MKSRDWIHCCSELGIHERTSSICPAVHIFIFLMVRRLNPSISWTVCLRLPSTSVNLWQIILSSEFVHEVDGPFQLEMIISVQRLNLFMVWAQILVRCSHGLVDGPLWRPVLNWRNSSYLNWKSQTWISIVPGKAIYAASRLSKSYFLIPIPIPMPITTPAFNRVQHLTILVKKLIFIDILTWGQESTDIWSWDSGLSSEIKEDWFWKNSRRLLCCSIPPWNGWRLKKCRKIQD